MGTRGALILSRSVVRLFAAAALVLAVPTARAEFGGREKAVTVGAGLAALALPALIDAPERARWDSALPLDGWAGVLGARSAEGVYAAAAASDLTLSALVAVSPLTFAGPSGGQARWQAVQSYALTGLLTTGIKAAAGRARPYVSQCRDNPLGQDCFSPERHASFVSGHAAFAFTAAGLMCSQRRDALCPVGVGLASATALLRVRAQRHHLSDVLAGAALGWVSGHALPRWRGRRVTEGAPPLAVGYAFNLPSP